ncbi:hypothetical protein CRYUN_Cryun19dG0097800 [Craigia yunnanensis]
MGWCLLAVCTTKGRVKLYRPPFSGFCAEWIEVLDITDRLYDYFASISFEEPDIPPSEISNEPMPAHGHVDDPPDSVSGKQLKRRRVSTSGVRNFGSETSCDQISCYKNGKDVNAGPSPSCEAEGQGPPKVLNSKSGRGKSSHQTVPAIKSKGKSTKKIPEVCSLPLITADRYASRSTMLSSLVAACSPLLKLSSEMCLVPENNSSNCFSLLAVGANSGKISFWRIHAPQYYSIEQNGALTAVELVGILQAHNSWVTTISWALLASDSSNPQVLLATGSSDGSVRIWIGHGKELLKSSEVNNAPLFPRLKIINIYAVQVSVLSLMHTQSLNKILLAVGKGSGAFEVWTGDISVKKFNKAGSYDAHDQVVTGLAWAFDGCFLCSCSQDNFVRSWSLRVSSLTEVPIPSSSPGLRSISDLPDVLISCLGLVASPSNLAIAMVRSFDVHQLWTKCMRQEKELIYLESNILWSLRQYGHWDKPLVFWDIIAALLAFKRSAPHYVDNVLVKWLSESFVDLHVEQSIEKADEINSNLLSLEGLDEANFAQDKQLNLWMELLSSSEREIRQRLVGFSFSAYKSLVSNSATCSSEPGYWYPLGVAQMEQWLVHNNCHVCEQLKVLATEIETCKRTDWH